MTSTHDFDCAIHNGPAYPAPECGGSGHAHGSDDPPLRSNHSPEFNHWPAGTKFPLPAVFHQPTRIK